MNVFCRFGRRSRKSIQSPYAGQKSQKYAEICNYCKRTNTLFEDPEFIADDSNIFYSQEPPAQFVWLRPPQICKKPLFFAQGVSRFDVKQGILGDCWLLAAIASLTSNEKLFHRVAPKDQCFGKGYCGVFRFSFWHQGSWTEVVIDDLLPTYNGELIFLHSAQKNEFWSALLEKAYAKLHGSYEALKGGSLCEAMVDFTGGVAEEIDLTDAPPNLCKIMHKAVERKSLMGCSVEPEDGVIEQKLPGGLIAGHAYSVNCIKSVEVKRLGFVILVRVQNPWGNESEWTGPWGDRSREWTMVSNFERRKLGLTFNNDGEFWMSFGDFCRRFTKLEICSLDPNYFEDRSKGLKKWITKVEHGRWIPDRSAGGCRNFLYSFWTNPQYRTTVTDPDEDDDDDLCTLIISVQQKDRRKQLKEGIEMLTIGYTLYKLPDGARMRPLDVSFFRENPPSGRSHSFINTREVTTRHQVRPGTYVIIPSTFKPNEEGDFLLRIFTEKSNVTEELDEPTSYSGLQSAASIELNNKETAKCKNIFRRKSNQSDELDASQLSEVLTSMFKETPITFTYDLCHSMIAMNDGDMSGKLGFVEFDILYKTLKLWFEAFRMVDRDNSGTLDNIEFRTAMHNCGFNIKNETLTAVYARFCIVGKKLDLTDFISCVVRLSTLIKTFNTKPRNSNGDALFGFEEFLQATIYS